jgi:hypothetical protein
MNGDRMEIRRKDPASDVVLCEDNVTRVKKACKSFPKYQGKRKPKCNCMPCWSKWTQTRVATDSSK